MSLSPSYPIVEVYSQVDFSEKNLKWLENSAREGIPLVLAHPGTEEPVLPKLTEVEVTLISDETIAQVHGEFLDDPTPTDVITFHHGEILISVETAERESTQYGKTWEEEILLYLVHGLLHLNGHTDLEEPERETMHQIQEDILSRILSGDARKLEN